MPDQDIEETTLRQWGLDHEYLLDSNQFIAVADSDPNSENGDLETTIHCSPRMLAHATATLMVHLKNNGYQHLLMESLVHVDPIGVAKSLLGAVEQEVQETEH